MQLNQLHQSTAQFVSHFINVSVPYILVIGLLLAIFSLCLISWNIIVARNGEERSMVLDGFKWVIVGVILLGVISPLIAYFIVNFY
ncbi:hypothetical protein [Clostridium massiliamazoniense]|uniref:hypothetical protein n=1 Tax=Clostridium massiliamazoniense TaxID=1347366 RepID=UPI0006D8011B|nr:hypothetical protein [Clostridium massiliamazoniense]